MLTDEQLNPMKKGAPLLVERYRELREKLKVAAGLMAASKETLELTRKQMEQVIAERDEWKRKHADLEQAFAVLRDNTSMR